MDIYLILAGYFFCRGVEAGEAKRPIACALMILWSIVVGIVYFTSSGSMAQSQSNLSF